MSVCCVVCVLCVCVVCECVLCGVCDVCEVCEVCVCVCPVCPVCRVCCAWWTGWRPRSRWESWCCRRGAVGSQGRPSGGAGRGLTAWIPEAWTGAPPGRQGPPGIRDPQKRQWDVERGPGTGGSLGQAGGRGNPEEGCLGGLMSSLVEFC